VEKGLNRLREGRVSVVVFGIFVEKFIFEAEAKTTPIGAAMASLAALTGGEFVRDLVLTLG